MNSIQIVPLDEDQIRKLSSLELKDTYVTSVNLVASLLSINLPLKNQRIALKNILEFLDYAQNTIENNTTITISRDRLNRYFNGNSREQYLKILKDLNVMTRVPYEDGKFYEIGKRSCQYRFHNSFIEDENCLVIIDNTSNTNKINSEIKVHAKFKKAIQKTAIDLKSALLAEIEHCKDKNNSILRKRLNRLFATNGDRFIKKGNKVSRIYHSFSNISKVSRQFQSIEGMKYNDIDIVNCQPMILCYYLLKNGLELDQQYITDTESGLFYENFIGIEGNFSINKNGFWNSEYLTLTRDDAKVQLYRSIFFNFNKSNPVNKRFSELYPTTYKSLENVANENTMASILQNIEAEIFNDLIPTASKYFYTLFDAIYFTSAIDTEALKNQILNKFGKLGLIPTLKITTT